MNRLRALLVAAVLMLAGCGAVPVEHYRDERPALDLQKYLNGTVDAWGIFQDRSGKVVSRHAPTTTPEQLKGEIEGLLG